MLNISDFDSTIEGSSKVINGSYKGNAFTVTYNVNKPKSVEDLQVVNQGKVIYFENQVYSTEGVVLKAKLDGQQNYTYIYSGFTSNLLNPLKITDKSTTLTYINKNVDIILMLWKRKLKLLLHLRSQIKLFMQKVNY